MVNLTRASRELFRRQPDETFHSLAALRRQCEQEKEASLDRWQSPGDILIAGDDELTASLEADRSFHFNDWSFTQLCRLSGVSKDTVNRLRPKTAAEVLRETMPSGTKPLQLLTTENRVRSIHGTQYARLWDLDLVDILADAEGFVPPDKGFNGATGLYRGEQDLFCFLIDPNGWVEIRDETFAPGFFVWNSEVGRRSLGIQAFWFQSICANHIVWDATEVVEWKRKHTGKVEEGLDTIRSIIGELVSKRDVRKDAFAKTIGSAMRTRLGENEEECLKVLTKHGITRALAQSAIAYAKDHGGFSIFSVVDALTRLTQRSQYVGSRTESDQKVSQLLNLAA